MNLKKKGQLTNKEKEDLMQEIDRFNKQNKTQVEELPENWNEVMEDLDGDVSD